MNLVMILVMIISLLSECIFAGLIGWIIVNKTGKLILSCFIFLIIAAIFMTLTLSYMLF